MSEPEVYGKAASILGLSPEEIEQVKAKLRLSRDRKLTSLRFAGDVFYVEYEALEGDVLTCGIEVYDSEVAGCKRLATFQDGEYGFSFDPVAGRHSVAFGNERCSGTLEACCEWLKQRVSPSGKPLSTMAHKSER